MVTHEQIVRRLNLTLGSSLIAGSAYQKRPTKNSHSIRWKRPSQNSSSAIKSQEHLTDLEFENRWRAHTSPQASNHSLTRWNCFVSNQTNLNLSFCYPKGNFGGNQLLDGSISLSPPILGSDDRFARQNRYELPPHFRMASLCPS